MRKIKMCSDDTKIKVGDRVKIKGQSCPVMTISKVSSKLLEETVISVVWFTADLEIREAKDLPKDMFVFTD
jgi:uncharacterized protein YodC (DUF2158 family)